MHTEALTCERRRGVTLVEVLVVIVLLGMLAAMLTPALGRARERGRMTACTRNQYQMAFAISRFDEERGHLPGWLNPSPNNVPIPSWPVVILPYLGRGDVFDMWGALPNPMPNIEQFLCPSVTVTKKMLDEYPVLHYAGNAGATGTNFNDGIMVNLRSAQAQIGLSLADVEAADGTSTTLAISEKATRLRPAHRWEYPTGMPSEVEFKLFRPLCPPDSSTQANTPPAWYPPVFGVGCPPPAKPAGQEKVINGVNPVDEDPNTPPDYSSFAPSSEHAGGVVVAYCDGHTAFLRDTVDHWVYGQLLTPRSRWVQGNNTVNSVLMQGWVQRNGAPYIFDMKDLK